MRIDRSSAVWKHPIARSPLACARLSCRNHHVSPGCSIVNVRIEPNRRGMSEAAAQHAAEALRRVISERGAVRIVAATGASQLEFLQELTAQPAIEWERVELFVLVEYVGTLLSPAVSYR